MAAPAIANPVPIPIALFKKDIFSAPRGHWSAHVHV